MSLRSLLVVFASIVLAGCAARERFFLINVNTLSPVLEAATPRSGAECAQRELRLSIGRANDVHAETCDNGKCTKVELGELRFLDRSGRVNPPDLRLGSGDATQGSITPVEGPDGLLWLCREDEEEQQCICIPWAQD